MKPLSDKCCESSNSLHLSLTEKRVIGYITSGLLIFSLGVIIFCHMYSSYPQNTDYHNQMEIFVRACAASFDMFLFNIDSNCVDGWLEYESHANVWGWLLATVALLAGVWTISVFALLLGSLCRRWRKQYASLKKGNTDLFIFIGINNRSRGLAKDIMTKSDLNAVCLFVVPPTEVQEVEKTIWDRISNVIQHKHHMYNDLGDIDAQVIVAEKMISDCEQSNFWMELGYPRIETYISHSKRIRVLLLGENETKNINDALILSNSSLWGEHMNTLTIHCLARRNNANRVIEDVTSRDVIEIIDSSHLAIELLKNDPKNHPVRFVDTKNGVVSSSFNSLIVGFSECGQDALRFIYEFSAFVDAKSTGQEDTRSPFYCHIVDNQMSPSAARWIHHAKGMFDKKNSDDKSPCITYNLQMDYNSAEFYSEVLDKIIDNLNYVVITVGDDCAGITLAVDILRYAIKTGRIKNQVLEDCSKDNFRIYVRSYNPKMYVYLQTIASHYNQTAEYITIFGAEKDLYTYDMLINETLTKEAMKYQYNYHKLANEHFSWENTPVKASKEEDWKQRRDKAFENNKFSDIQNLRRQESQDYANALHLETKKCLKLYGASAIRLAQTEHLRWMAAHEIMGFSSNCPNGGNKDILHYGHSDMTSWKDLSGDTREYDFLTFNELFSKEELSEAIKKAREDAPDYKA